MRRAVIPGSFDPVTVGHIDLIRRAALLFDEVYVVAFENCDKRGLFDMDTRLRFLTLSTMGITDAKIIAAADRGMLADFVIAHKIDAIIKGARNATDFDYEYWLSIINRSFDARIETIILPARAEYQHISSTVVRELIKFGKPLDGYVPDEITALIKAENTHIN